MVNGSFGQQSWGGSRYTDPFMGSSRYANSFMQPSRYNAPFMDQSRYSGGSFGSAGRYDNIPYSKGYQQWLEQAMEVPDLHPEDDPNSVNAPGNEWGKLNGMDGAFSTAEEKSGTPTDVIKSIIGIESGMGSELTFKAVPIYNADGSPRTRADGTQEYAIQGTGMTSSAAESIGYDWNRMQTDSAYAIEAVGVLLNTIANTSLGPDGVYGTQDDNTGGGKTIYEEYGWEGVALTYYAGGPTAQLEDSYGTTSEDYRNRFNSNMQSLEKMSLAPPNIVQAPADEQAAIQLSSQMGAQAGGISVGAPSPTLGVSQIGDGMYPGISQGMGMTDFYIKNSGPGGIYENGYEKAYGFTGHPGVDIPYERGTALKSPVEGTVIVVGTSPDGNRYFGDSQTQAPNSGQLAIQLDNGDVVLMGHMSLINVQPGQRVKPGEYVGLSGTYGTGNHLHLEVRVATQWDQNGQPTAWSIADPYQYLGF